MMGLFRSGPENGHQDGEDDATLPDTDPRTATIFLAWDETGSYAVGVTEEDALEGLDETSDGQYRRCKRFSTTIFLPFVADGGTL